MLKLIIAFLLSVFFSHPAMAYGYGVQKPVAYPTANPVSRAGKVTGGECSDSNDCMPGCLTGSDDLVCVTQSEANDSCVSPDEPRTIDRICACLPDVKRCGYAYPKKDVQSAPPAERPIAEKTKTPKPKSTHKKKHHKKKSAKKTEPKK